MSEIRQTLRTLARDSGFSTTVILTLALGIGATTAMFSVVNSVLLSPLPYSDPDRLYLVTEMEPAFAHKYPRLPVNAFHFTKWVAACDACESLALARSTSPSLTGDGPPETLSITLATWQYFPLLGVRPQLGRLISQEDDQPDAERVIVLTDKFWRRRFDADPEIVGKSIRIASVPVTVIGVAAPGLTLGSGTNLDGLVRFAEGVDGFQPLRLRYAEIRTQGNFNFTALARLKADATPAKALAQMNASIAQYAAVFAVSALLLACFGIYGVVSYAVASRTKEIGVRMALGADRRRVLELVIRQGLAPVVAGVAVGLVGAFAIGRFIESLLFEVSASDPLTFVGVAGVLLVVGALACYIPARRAAGVTPLRALRYE